MFSTDEIDRPWMVATGVASLAMLSLEQVKSWSTRGLISWHGEARGTYQKRHYSLCSVVEAAVLKACVNSGTPLDPHGKALAAAMVRRLRHHHERGVEFLLGTDEDEHHWIAFAYAQSEGETKVVGRYVLHSQPVAAFLGDLPLDAGAWELRLFPADYFLSKIVDDYLHHRRHNVAAWERSLLAGAGSLSPATAIAPTG